MTTLRFDDVETYRQQVQRIIVNAEQRLSLFDTDLSQPNLDSIANAAALQALCQVAKNEASVRLLIRDERHFERDCARLQKVYQLFGHRLALRITHSALARDAALFAYNDRFDYVTRFHPDSMRGSADEDDSATCATLAAQFETLWETAEPISGGKILGL